MLQEGIIRRISALVTIEKSWEGDAGVAFVHGICGQVYLSVRCDGKFARGGGSVSAVTFAFHLHC